MAIIDLQRIQYLKLPSGELANSLTVHELRKKIAKLGIEVATDDGKQALLVKLDDFYKAKEMAERLAGKQRINQGEIIVRQVQAATSKGAA